MSWDARLIDDRGHTEGEWNYTHNCNRMIDAVLSLPVDESTFAPNVFGGGWWKHLDGMDGEAGQALLAGIVDGLQADPARFRAMEPANKWGSYIGVLGVLREMRDAKPEWPCRWEVSG